ncbi:uncharacterized protein LOC123274601 [Cotesia glomerata]|uniref:Essential protein Yae1 N-terminal domain-containing protein n=1 Tax=Cotesia glomerata TaxID=32391 RepID=A0AAV7IAW4_COTGL|nr:uncharacterized protein LOC123274601 [Cotesia glomerata]KAH0556599.1 hypothetical protein KQX54_001113 [Cotesia glomerata]
MNDSSEIDETLEVASKTWDRVIETANKTGFREGVDVGSEAVLQEDFDRGYVDGFKIAYILGKYKGLANSLFKNIEHPKEINDILEKTRRGACHICESQYSGVIQDQAKILAKHEEHTLKICKILQGYFEPLLKNFKIDINDIDLK